MTDNNGHLSERSTEAPAPVEDTEITQGEAESDEWTALAKRVAAASADPEISAGNPAPPKKGVPNRLRGDGQQDPGRKALY